MQDFWTRFSLNSTNRDDFVRNLKLTPKNAVGNNLTTKLERFRPGGPHQEFFNIYFEASLLCRAHCEMHVSKTSLKSRS